MWSSVVMALVTYKPVLERISVSATAVVVDTRG